MVDVPLNKKKTNKLKHKGLLRVEENMKDISEKKTDNKRTGRRKTEDSDWYYNCYNNINKNTYYNNNDIYDSIIIMIIIYNINNNI